MRLVRLPLFFLILLLAFRAGAQMPSSPDGVLQPRILILLDGSSSMLQPWGKDLVRFSAAGKIITTLMDSIYKVNNQVEFALRVYGHQSPAQDNDCQDTRREVMFSKNNLTQMSLRLASLRPIGVSPIAYALKEAALNDLSDEAHNAYSIILITDGGESCNGNICDVVKSLIERKIYFKPYILSLVDYAPLRSQYACLGSYLQVAKEGDIGPAISSIVASYRPMLSLPSITATKPVAPKPAAPDITTISIPTWIPAPVTGMGTLPFVVRKGEADVFHYNPLLRPVRQLPITVTRPESEPAAITPAVSRATPTPEIKNNPSPVKPEPVHLPAKPVSSPPRDTTRTSVVIKAIPPPLKTTIKPLPARHGDNKPKDADFTSSVEDAKETTAEIYFTDGHGKFYKSTPQLQFLDPVTGKTVKQFYRTVNGSGNPDPQTVPPGTYRLLIAGKANLMTKNLVIQPNKKNKILITVSNGSIIFQYDTAPGRPVTEFDAIVNIRFEPGPTVKQRCTAELPYAPGTYYIEVNTLPISHYSADVDFGAATIIPVQEPGYVQIMNAAPLGKVSLYYPLGDQFVRFYGMDITGRPEEQKLRLKPGTYEAHWVKNGNLPYASETIQRFQVKSNSLTEIELH